MLVTKWKNSSPKAKSVTVMLVILLSLTLCLMAFLPFFQTRAASEFSTPLTEMSFIEQLYQSNYIQYKYLKEKTDQKNWSYSDLYLTIRNITTISARNSNTNTTFSDTVCHKELIFKSPFDLQESSLYSDMPVRDPAKGLFPHRISPSFGT